MDAADGIEHRPAGGARDRRGMWLAAARLGLRAASAI